MSTAMYLFDRSYKAEQDLSNSQYRIVELSGTDQVDTCDNAADYPFGVLQNDPLAGEAATVRHLGVSKVVSDGTANGGISVGSPVGTDAQGRAVRKSANNDVVLGRALDASSVAGAIIRVLMTGNQYLGV